MSIHFLLNLSFDCSEEDLERIYKKKLTDYHPDRSKKDTTNLYFELQDEYKKYKNNLLNDNFILECCLNEVNLKCCRCGTFFDSVNLTYDRVECTTCSCFIVVSKEKQCLL